ncbi:MAG: glycosyltransferase family 39 protein [bacterium]
MPDRSYGRIGRPERIAVALLLVAFVSIAVASMRGKNPTFDETAHLPAGVSYVQAHDFRLNAEHPAFPKLLAGAAATVAGAKADTTLDAWRAGEQWDFGRAMLYESGADSRRIVFAGRLPLVLLGAILGLLIWAWARAMHGPAAALVALALWTFSPTALAHTRLVTTDVPLTLFVTGAAACLWQARRTGRLRWTFAAAACVAGSMVTKFSAFSYGPVWLLLAAWPLPARRTPRLAHTVIFLASAFVATELAVWVCYAFPFDWTTIRALGMTGRGVTPESMSLLRRIPFEVMASIPWPSADFARGMKDIILFTEAGHPVYLLGRPSDTGTWWSPLLTLGVKTSLPLLALALFGLGHAIVRGRRRPADLVFLLAPPALVLATNLLANLGLGVRHLLPMFPFAILLASRPFAGGGWPHGLLAFGSVAGLLLWHAAGTLVAFPHYLPFFNEIARATGGGYRYLGDSNLDWGQDLSAASRELRARGATHAVLCYFGTASPFVEGLDWQLLPPTQRALSRDPWKTMPAEGEQWLLMSATNRQGIYYRTPEGGPAYPWLDGVKPDAVIGDGTIFLYEISTNDAVQRGMADLYLRHGMREEAENALRRALAKVQFDLASRRRLFAMLRGRGAFEEAEALMLDAPNPDVPAILEVVDLQEEMGKYDAEHESFRRALRGFKHDADLKNAFAWFLQKHDRDLDEALRLASEAVEWTPEDPYYRDTLGMVYLARGEAERAREEFETALRQPEGDLPAIRWHRALALLDLGEVAEVREIADRLLNDPTTDESTLGEISEWLAR